MFIPYKLPQSHVLNKRSCFFFFSLIPGIIHMDFVTKAFWQMSILCNKINQNNAAFPVNHFTFSFISFLNESERNDSNVCVPVPVWTQTDIKSMFTWRKSLFPEPNKTQAWAPWQWAGQQREGEANRSSSSGPAPKFDCRGVKWRLWTQKIAGLRVTALHSEEKFNLEP